MGALSGDIVVFVGGGQHPTHLRVGVRVRAGSNGGQW
jgi:hypothetical protein